jgi:predicted PurR-regulated permease PerM
LALLTQVSQYAIYLIVSGILVGAVTTLAFWWLGVAYAPLWGLAAGALNAVPYLGPTIVRIHPVAVFLSIIFWSWLWGPIGTFLAVPSTTAIKTVMDNLPEAGKTAELLDDGTTRLATGDTASTSLQGAKA